MHKPNTSEMTGLRHLLKTLLSCLTELLTYKKFHIIEDSQRSKYVLFWFETKEFFTIKIL